MLGSVLALYLYPRLATAGVSFTSFALFIGVAMSVTAFPVLARILEDRRMTASELGIVAYEVLTGQKPFQGDTPEEILRKQLDRSGFSTPRQLNADVPPAVEKSILKCLERDPERRHPIMSVLVLELKAALYV